MSTESTGFSSPLAVPTPASPVLVGGVNFDAMTDGIAYYIPDTPDPKWVMHLRCSDGLRVRGWGTSQDIAQVEAVLVRDRRDKLLELSPAGQVRCIMARFPKGDELPNAIDLNDLLRAITRILV
jgi:hypothetical protein